MVSDGKFKNEEEREKDLEENANPYQRLHYIYELAIFYKQMDFMRAPEDFQSLLDKLTRITRKYKK